MKKFIGIIILLIFILPLLSYAAPLPEGIAINKETKQCSSFWAGDEFTYISLPDGWQDYYSETYYTFETPNGSCSVKEGDDVEKCCNQLNLKTLNTSEFKKDNTTDCLEQKNKITTICKCKLDESSATKISSDGISINNKTKECAGILEFSNIPDFVTITNLKERESGCFPDEIDWKRYHVSKYEGKITTPAGSCDYDGYNEEECCKQLGLEYIKKVDTIAKESEYGIQYREQLKKENKIESIKKIGLISLIPISIIIGIIIFLKKKKSKS